MSFHTLDESMINRPNALYTRFGADHSMENQAWSIDRCLNTYDDALRDKVMEGLVAVSELEFGGPPVL